MTGNENGAYELNHRGVIHRASSFGQLLGWVKEYRVSAKDTFRKAGTEEWLPVMSQREFASILNPDNQWTVSMASGVFRAPDFDTVALWARESRLTEDAVIEGPRTPPGGVKASALPAVSPHLRELPGKKENAPWLEIDGRTYRAPDTETVRKWIRESRVPLEAGFSLDGENWEPVSSCGLFDLEDWPSAAHGTMEEPALPVMPEIPPDEEPGPAVTVQDEVQAPDEDNEDEATEKEAQVDPRTVPFVVTTSETEITVESVSELKRLLKKRLIFTYDEISHPTIPEESLSVGEFLERARKAGSRRVMWFWGVPLLAVAAAAVLELTGVIEVVPWF